MMKPCETSAAIGYNRYHDIDDLPLDYLEKCAVLEYLARKLWIILEESTGAPEYAGKTYDPLIIEGNIAHSYVFDLEDGGRHHSFKDLKHLETMLINEAISRLLYRPRGALVCSSCGMEYLDLSKVRYEHQFWWCSNCNGKLVPRSLFAEGGASNG